MDKEYSYKFGAILGAQGGNPFYQATVPFRVLASMLKLDDDADVTQRSQRLIDKSRAKKVTKYLEKNKDGFYVLPPLVGYIEGEFEFEQVQLDGFFNVGRMHVSVDARIKLFDGQHRAWGIREALQIEPLLSTENISIMFFSELSLSQRQQAFHDINFTQKTPSASICIAYNSRNDLDRRVIDTFSQSNLRAFIEYEKNTASAKSENLYSLKNLKDYAIQFFAGDKEAANPDFEEFTNAFFETVNLPAHITLLEMENKALIKHGFNAIGQLKSQSVLPHAVTVKSIGMLGKALIEQRPEDWREALAPLAKRAFWSRSAPGWLGRCVSLDGKMISNMAAVRLTYYKIALECGLTLSEREQEEHEEALKLTEQL